MIQIDLRKLEAPMVAFVKDAVAKFVAAHPDEEISSVGLSGDGFHGWITIHFDTAANSELKIREFLKKYPQPQESTWWRGEDEHGLFGIFGEEFAFPGQSAFRLPRYPDFYTVDPEEPVRYIDLNGKTIAIDRDEGNEAFNRIIFRFLKKILRPLEPFNGLRLARTARAGIEINDSKYVEFWIIRKKGRANGRS